MKKVYLLGRSGIHANEKLLLEGEVIIGRDPQMCQLIYPANEKKISGVHCKVQEINGNICLIDLNSTNGTYFQDGTKLEPDMPRTITSGQGFYLGSRENSFDVLVEETADAKKRRMSGLNSAGQGDYEDSGRESVSGKFNSPQIIVMAVAMVFVIAVGGAVGYHFYQKAQSANEEVQRANEEIQKVNEEMQKVNEELQKASEEADKSTIENIVDDIAESDSLWDAVTNLLK